MHSENFRRLFLWEELANFLWCDVYVAIIYDEGSYCVSLPVIGRLNLWAAIPYFAEWLFLTGISCKVFKTGVCCVYWLLPKRQIIFASTDTKIDKIYKMANQIYIDISLHEYPRTFRVNPEHTHTHTHTHTRFFTSFKKINIKIDAKTGILCDKNWHQILDSLVQPIFEGLVLKIVSKNVKKHLI